MSLTKMEHELLGFLQSTRKDEPYAYGHWREFIAANISPKMLEAVYSLCDCGLIQLSLNSTIRITPDGNEAHKNGYTEDKPDVTMQVHEMLSIMSATMDCHEVAANVVRRYENPTRMQIAGYLAELSFTIKKYHEQDADYKASIATAQKIDNHFDENVNEVKLGA